MALVGADVDQLHAVDAQSLPGVLERQVGVATAAARTRRADLMPVARPLHGGAWRAVGQAVQLGRVTDHYRPVGHQARSCAVVDTRRHYAHTHTPV